MTNRTESPRDQLVRVGATLAAGGHSPGTSGNLSVRIGQSILVTPTGARLGALSADQLSEIDLFGQHRAGPTPTKEAPFHAAIYAARPEALAVVHLHSPYATALSCLADLEDALVPLTPYAVAKLGAVRVVRYGRPGSTQLADAVGAAAAQAPVLLLANHGAVIADIDLDAAAAVAEELEQAARLHFTLAGHRARPLTTEEVAEILRLRAG